MDMKLELIGIPVTDIDRANAFYEQVGFNADHDHTVSDEIRFVQMTPPGSACSIAFGQRHHRSRRRAGARPPGRRRQRRSDAHRPRGARRRGERDPGLPLGSLRLLPETRTATVGRAGDPEARVIRALTPRPVQVSPCQTVAQARVQAPPADSLLSASGWSRERSQRWLIVEDRVRSISSVPRRRACTSHEGLHFSLRARSLGRGE